MHHLKAASSDAAFFVAGLHISDFASVATCYRMSRINTLLKFCLGADESGGYQPIGFEDRLSVTISEASQSEYELLLSVLNMDWELDRWAHASLSEAAQKIEQILAQRYPELEPMVLRALSNRWSYGWH
ncbi:MAG TPA: hypothetical protein VHL60_05385 [Oxalicibacterium sp.]|nr:hypothetical protein [Oxalicibacterium sp.]